MRSSGPPDALHSRFGDSNTSAYFQSTDYHGGFSRTGQWSRPRCSTTTIPLMILIVALLLMMVSQIGRGPIQLLPVENLRIAALMIAMSKIGMIIEPSIPLPSDLPAENALGIIIILIPAILILAMVLPNGSNTKEEEE